MLERAASLVHEYPTALASLSRGMITETHTTILVDLLGTVAHDGLRAGLVDTAVELAERLPTGSFRRALQKLVDTVQARTVEQRHRAALGARRVTMAVDVDGMAWLSVYVPAVEARAIIDRVNRIAGTIVDAEAAGVVATAESADAVDVAACQRRTREQVRADVICDLLVDGAVAEHPLAAQGIRATVNVTVPALALLGTGDGYAEVEGVGPIPMSRARELCGTSDDWTRILTHPETGAILSVGRTQYRPPASLRRLVAYRAERCMAPGCGISADRCDIDHTTAWEHGGHTSHTNLAPLCRGHHTLKHHTNWEVRSCAG